MIQTFFQVSVVESNFYLVSLWNLIRLYIKKKATKNLRGKGKNEVQRKNHRPLNPFFSPLLLCLLELTYEQKIKNIYTVKKKKNHEFHDRPGLFVQTEKKMTINICGRKKKKKNKIIFWVLSVSNGLRNIH